MRSLHIQQYRITHACPEQGNECIYVSQYSYNSNEAYVRSLRQSQWKERSALSLHSPGETIYTGKMLEAGALSLFSGVRHTYHITWRVGLALVSTAGVCLAQPSRTSLTLSLYFLVQRAAELLEQQFLHPVCLQGKLSACSSAAPLYRISTLLVFLGLPDDTLCVFQIMIHQFRLLLKIARLYMSHVVLSE